MRNSSLTVINLFAGPGAGKSTNAAGIFYNLKSKMCNVELVTEFAKEKVYEGHFGCMEDQLYIFAKQQRRLKRLVGHVDIAVTDSPLFLSILYNKDKNNTFTTLVKETFDSYNNFNFYITRKKPYVKIGRTQEETEAWELDFRLNELLKEYNIPISYVDGDENCAKFISDKIIEWGIYEGKTV